MSNTNTILHPCPTCGTSGTCQEVGSGIMAGIAHNSVSNTNKRSWTELINNEYPHGLWHPDMYGNRMADVTKDLIEYLSSITPESTKDCTCNRKISERSCLVFDERCPFHNNPCDVCGKVVCSGDNIHSDCQSSPTEVPEKHPHQTYNITYGKYCPTCKRYIKLDPQPEPQVSIPEEIEELPIDWKNRDSRWLTILYGIKLEKLIRIVNKLSQKGGE